jgi:hypothetical protein
VNEAAVMLTEAALQAQEITFTFAAEARVYARVKADLNLTDEGLLSYVVGRGGTHSHADRGSRVESVSSLNPTTLCCEIEP